MDPISILVTALVTGAAAGLQEKAGQAVKDAYDGLRSLLNRDYPDVDVEQIEKKPESTKRQDVLKEELEETGAARDEEILQQAQRLLQLIKDQAPEAARTVGVSLEDVEAAANVNIEDIKAHGPGATGVQARNVRAGGDFNVRGVEVDAGGNSDPNS